MFAAFAHLFIMTSRISCFWKMLFNFYRLSTKCFLFKMGEVMIFWDTPTFFVCIIRRIWNVMEPNKVFPPFNIHGKRWCVKNLNSANLGKEQILGIPCIFLISFTSLIYVHSALRSSNSRADGRHVFMRPVTFVTLTRDPRVTCDRVWLVWKTFYRQCKCGVSCAATTPSQKKYFVRTRVVDWI